MPSITYFRSIRPIFAGTRSTAQGGGGLAPALSAVAYGYDDTGFAQGGAVNRRGSHDIEASPDYSMTEYPRKGGETRDWERAGQANKSVARLVERLVRNGLDMVARRP